MSRKPNIIVVYTDQQRYDTLGCNGNQLIRTPTLDGLAAGGVNCSEMHVNCPLCQPSRSAFMTGRYNRSNGAVWNHHGLPPGELTLPVYVRDHGYRTAFVGKDHCFDHALPSAFDEVCLRADHLFIDDDRPAAADIRAARAGMMQKPWAPDLVPHEQNITAQCIDAAIGSLEAQSGRTDAPLFLWCSIPDPHPPYMVSEPFASMYDGVAMPPPAWRDNEMADKPYRQQLAVQWDRWGTEYGVDGIDRLRRIYWGMVSCIDHHLARLLTALDARGMREETILLFTSDHGDYMGDHRLIRKGPAVYSALTRVPCIWSWPGLLPAQRSAAPMSNVDIFPTLCELAGLPLPDRLQGVSQAPVLRGQQPHARDAVFFEHGWHQAPVAPGELSNEEAQAEAVRTAHHLGPVLRRGRCRGLRDQAWTYIRNEADVEELYDRRQDPDELVNRATDPALAATLGAFRLRLLDWLIATDEPCRWQAASLQP